MKVAIVGSRGFIGSRIATEASRRGWLVNHIGSATKNRAALLQESDAVVHSVGNFMPDSRYKKLVQQPVSIGSLAGLAALKLGLSAPNPLEKSWSLEEVNFGTVKSTVEALLQNEKDAQRESRIPFVFMSATEWALSDPNYILSKRHAEQYLKARPELRAVFLRPGFVIPSKPRTCQETTPRHLIDHALSAVNSPARVSVDSIAVAACDAIEDSACEGIIECDVLRELDSQSYAL